MLRIVVACFFGLFLASCNQPHSSLLNTNALPADTFRIKSGVDTVIETRKGARLRIPASALSKDAALVVQEAYSMRDIVRAGLRTRSGAVPLSSGGMIRIAATDNDVSLNAPIGVELPAERYDASMRLYKGEVGKDGIDWIDPAPLQEDRGLYEGFQTGMRVFETQCRSCHAIDKDGTGPGLAYFTERGPWSNEAVLYEFINNAPYFIKDNSYARCLQKKYGSVMPTFHLTKGEVSSVVDYVTWQTQRMAIPRPAELDCADSCRKYEEALKALDSLAGKREVLKRENEERVDVQMTLPPPPVNLENADIQVTEAVPQDYVVPRHYTSEYYRFEIKSFGWYNVDKLFDFPEAVDSYLGVDVQSVETSEWNVFIAVPKYKVFYEGGKLAGKENSYGFHTTDGKIKLPPGTPVTVFALSEKGGKVYFAAQSFSSTTDNRITLQPKVYDKSEFDRLIASLQLGDVSIEVQASKNAETIRTVDQQAKEQQQRAEQYRPKNCPCDCGGEAGDTTMRPAPAAYPGK